MFKRLPIVLSVFMTILFVCINTVPVFAANYNPNLAIITIGEDSYYNCDFVDTYYGYPDHVDQPLNLIFYGSTINTIVNKTVVKDSLAGDGFLFSGSTMRNALDDGFGWYADQDSGRKNNPIDTGGEHYRLYATNGINMSNEAWNNYVIATSHVDNIPLYGFNENSEDYICWCASLHPGWAVFADLFYFQNRDWPGRWDGTQYWMSDGYVSLIRLP